ncbi:MAG: GMP/IMP nucleotidase [Thiomargarita sp.]|nr:GMP/IMP nucleotidase [Thiomargarita sp.]
MLPQTIDSPLNWQQIDTVFLDMDGTLLDLHYDNQFWQRYVPQCYAEKHDLSVDEATKFLLKNYKNISGTLNWYCVDYWTAELDMDIGELKANLAHLIAIHPHVPEFLLALRNHHKRVVLLTNAHYKSISLKMRKTQLTNQFDKIICAHDLGLPKENEAFWQKLQGVETFNIKRTLLIDDSLPVLRSAKNYGIANLLSIYQPDSHLPPNKITEFNAINNFLEIMPKN